MSIQQSYREGTVRGASPVELVVRLHEQMIEDLRQAGVAIERGDIERRTRCINHAILIVGHLQSSLDFANGDKVTRDLDHFYNVLRHNLIHVQFHPSKQGLAQLTTDLLAVRSAWIEVERAEKRSMVAMAPATAPRLFHSSEESDTDSNRVPMDWQG